eukprot:COSAG02_NODE_667_length_18713_cov_17.795262_6_plen_44_part_00
MNACLPLGFENQDLLSIELMHWFMRRDIYTIHGMIQSTALARH